LIDFNGTSIPVTSDVKPASPIQLGYGNIVQVFQFTNDFSFPLVNTILGMVLGFFFFFLFINDP